MWLPWFAEYITRSCIQECSNISQPLRNPTLAIVLLFLLPKQDLLVVNRGVSSVCFFCLFVHFHYSLLCSIILTENKQTKTQRKMSCKPMVYCDLQTSSVFWRVLVRSQLLHCGALFTVLPSHPTQNGMHLISNYACTYNTNMWLHVLLWLCSPAV